MTEQSAISAMDIATSPISLLEEAVVVKLLFVIEIFEFRLTAKFQGKH